MKLKPAWAVRVVGVADADNPVASGAPINAPVLDLGPTILAGVAAAGLPEMGILGAHNPALTLGARGCGVFMVLVSQSAPGVQCRASD